jgi:hypothetical protein
MMPILFASVMCKIVVAVEGKGLHLNLAPHRFFVNLFIYSSGSYGNNNSILIDLSLCPCVVQSYISIILNVVTFSV